MRGPGALTLFVEIWSARVVRPERLRPATDLRGRASAVFDFGTTVINLFCASEARELIEPGTVACPGSGSRFMLTIWVDDADAACAGSQ